MEINNGIPHYEWIESTTPNVSDIIIMIHGLGLDMRCWDPIIPSLTQHFHILRYDIRGHGQSKYQYPIHSEALVDDLYVLVSKLKIRSFHLVAYGLGGNISIKFYMKYKNFIKSIIFISTLLYYPEDIIKQINLRRSSLIEEGSLIKLAEDIVNKICCNPTLNMRKKLLQAFEKISYPTYFEFLSLEPTEYNLLPALNQIKVPVLHIAGEFDGICPPFLYGYGMSLIENGRTIILPGASNAAHIDQPDQVSHLIIDHINRFGNDRLHSVGRAQNYSNVVHTFMSRLLRLPQKQDNQMNVEVLHTFCVKINGEIVADGWNTRRARELLLYLIIHRKCERETLCEVFWPDLTMDRARNNLRVSLNYLKRLLSTHLLPDSQGFLAITRNTIELKGKIECDLIQYMKRIENTLLEENLEKRVQRSNQLFQQLQIGTFLPYTYDWILDLRERIENQLIELANWYAQYHISNRQYLAAVDILERVSSFVNVDIHVYQTIIFCYEKLKNVKRVKLWKHKMAEFYQL